MRRLALVLLLALPSCAIRPMVRLHECTVYTFAATPQSLYWTVCDD